MAIQKWLDTWVDPPRMFPELVSDLFTTDSHKLFETIVGCFNEKLSPAYMLTMVSKASVQLIGYEGWSITKLLDLWLRDDLAVTHSDLICFSKDAGPVTWLFSPFQSRPLGKELPNILMTCTCPTLDKSNSSHMPSEHVRKVWKVTHNAKPGKLLREIEVKASCSVCKQLWKLPTETLHSELRHVSGLYAAIVPYFSP
jgi:hypothetical protein